MYPNLCNTCQSFAFSLEVSFRNEERSGSVTRKMVEKAKFSASGFTGGVEQDGGTV